MSFQFNDNSGGGFSVSSAGSSTNLASNKIYLIDTSGGIYTMALPTPVAGAQIIIKDATGNAEENYMQLSPTGGSQIDGIAGIRRLQAAFGSWYVVSNGTHWFLI